MPVVNVTRQDSSAFPWRLPAYLLIGFFVYCLYIFGIWQNPSGCYVDESALSYNAYLVSQTGAGESGVKFPLYFPVYTGGFTQYSNPTQIYLLAILFKIFGPGILTARLFAAACMFGACALLGLLARRISGRNTIGIIVGGFALLTPWLFEVGRLVLETFFYPMAVVLLLWSVFRASRKQIWNLFDAGAIGLSLTLLTYSYTIGRLLGPLLAGGLIVFAVNRRRMVSVLKVWVIFGLSLVPLIVYIVQNPALTSRFYLLSYIKPESTYVEIAANFIRRFFEDINPLTMLLAGDINPRHHLPDAYGSFYFSIFVLAIGGIAAVIARHRRDSWWWYVIFGMFASVVPGSLTVDSFHTLRMIAYPVFLMVLTIPSLTWLLEGRQDGEVGTDHAVSRTGQTKNGAISWQMPKSGLLAVLLVFGTVEAAYFHWNYNREGGKRGYVFDAAYKPLYDQAVSQPLRPIYLVDGYWGPAYIHSFWYATLEGREIEEFIHLPYGKRPPAGGVAISTEQTCTNCEMIRRNGDYLLYRTR